jgi:regulator of ribonuclease activity A
MELLTSELYDAHPDHVFVAEPVFRDFGGAKCFHGPVETVRAYEDDSLIRSILDEPGEGRVLVIDGAGSMRCALLGAQAAESAAANDWAGIVVHGAVRESRKLSIVPLGIKALGTNPRRPILRSESMRSIPLHLAGISFKPGEWLYADEDGLLVAWEALHEGKKPRRRKKKP